MTVINGAIGYLNDRELHQANSIATSLHGVAATIAGCNGVKQAHERTEYVNPYGLALYRREAKALVPVAAARTTLRLWDEGKLPGWVTEWLDRRLLEAAAA